MKTQADYIKEIAEEINNGTRYDIDNPTVEDIKKLDKHDYIVVNESVCFPVIIRRRHVLDTVLNVPVLFETDGYEIGDTVMGMIPETLTAEECLEELKGYKGEETI